MDTPANYCVYYDMKTEKIIDFFPSNIDPTLKSAVIAAWQQEIPRKILKAISEGEISMQELRKQIGHSNSTLHENVLKLEEQGLINTKIIYRHNKIRLLSPTILFVTKGPKYKSVIRRFFQGIWVDSDANKRVVSFLKSHPEKYFTAEEIAAKTSIPVDQVEYVLSNWESQVTRALSDFLKKKPFEKKVLYKGIVD